MSSHATLNCTYQWLLRKASLEHKMTLSFYHGMWHITSEMIHIHIEGYNIMNIYIQAHYDALVKFVKYSDTILRFISNEKKTHTFFYPHSLLHRDICKGRGEQKVKWLQIYFFVNLNLLHVLKCAYWLIIQYIKTLSKSDNWMIANRKL